MNKIYALIGPHASGKTTILNALPRQDIAYITSYTTRPPRKREINSLEYKFVSKEDFFKLDLIEKITYQGEYYGITKTEMLDKLKNNESCILTTTLSGIKQLKKLFGTRLESIYIMIDYVTMVERMLSLGENNAMIQSQLEYAEKNQEFELFKAADHVIKNTGSLNISVSQLMAIMGLVVPKK